MEFAERMRAERALEATQSNSSDLEWPSAASRIRTARLKSGLNETEIARRMGGSVDSYCDLEMYDDEAFTVATLSDLVTLGQIFGEEPRVLLLGPEAERLERAITFTHISRELARRIEEPGSTTEQLGDAIGFSVEEPLASPEALWNYDVEGLYNICKVLGIDWVSALPDLAARSRQAIT